MLDARSQWWKYIPTKKFRYLLNEAMKNPKVDFITCSAVTQEIVLLNRALEAIGMISISSEELTWFKPVNIQIVKEDKT